MRRFLMEKGQTSARHRGAENATRTADRGTNQKIRRLNMSTAQPPVEHASVASQPTAAWRSQQKAWFEREQAQCQAQRMPLALSEQMSCEKTPPAREQLPAPSAVPESVVQTPSVVVAPPLQPASSRVSPGLPCAGGAATHAAPCCDSQFLLLHHSAGSGRIGAAQCRGASMVTVAAPAHAQADRTKPGRRDSR